MDIILENKGFTDFQPVNFGTERCIPCHSFGPNIRNCYLIHYIHSGEGQFANPKNTYKLSKGQAFLIRPGEICTYKADHNRPWEYTWIGFNGNLAKKFDDLDDVFRPDETLFAEITSATSMSCGVEEYLAGALFRLYGELFSAHMQVDYVKKAANYIKTNYMNRILISEIASSLNINRKYLSRIFRERMGVSMQQYLIGKRLGAANKFLDSGYSVSETAHLVGYSDSFAFSKAFKSFFGYSPSSCKRRN